MYELLQKKDPEIFAAVEKEFLRQQNNIELIASENFTSQTVMQACGTVLTNKYAEGYPAKRYYGGCEFVDIVEELACTRAKKLFGAEHVNAQPHSGAQANTAVYLAFLKPGDTVLGMDLAHGGHLTHGSPVNISGLYYNFVPYGVNQETEQIDYQVLEDLAIKHQPKMIVAGASAYPRTIDFARFRQIADKVGAILFVDMAHIAGLVAAGWHPSPVPYCEVVTTTTHKTLRGPRGGLILCKQEFAKQINKAIFPGTQGGPLMHIIAAKAVALKEALSPEFKDYQAQIIKNAQALSCALKEKNWRLVSGGTDNHLMLVDVKKRGLTGKEAEFFLDQSGITVNKNTIPFETESPFVTSGIRLGTPAVTTRGMQEAQMKIIADCFDKLLTNPQTEMVLKEVQAEVAELCQKFPLYQK